MNVAPVVVEGVTPVEFVYLRTLLPAPLMATLQPVAEELTSVEVARLALVVLAGAKLISDTIRTANLAIFWRTFRGWRTPSASAARLMRFTFFSLTHC